MDLIRYLKYKHKPHSEVLAATTFHSFNKLPAELRIKIWSLALPEPRHLLVSSRLTREGVKAWRNGEPVSDKVEDCFLRISIQVYGDDEERDRPSRLSAPEFSPLRLACRESSVIWSTHYQRIKVLEDKTPFIRIHDYELFRNSVPLMEGPQRKGESRGPRVEIRRRGFIDYRRDTLILGENMSKEAFFIERTKSFFYIDISQCRSIAYRLQMTHPNRKILPFLGHFSRACPRLEKITYVLGGHTQNPRVSFIVTVPNAFLLYYLCPSYKCAERLCEHGIFDYGGMYMNYTPNQDRMEKRWKEFYANMLESSLGTMTLEVAYMEG
jgi:hypothetical protein